MIAGFDPARLGAALGASLLVHMALLSAFGPMPGSRPGSPLAQLGERALRATLRPAPETASMTDVQRAVAPSAPATTEMPGRAGTPQTSDEPAAAVIPTRAAPRYYAPHELDQRPQVLTHIEPAFPAGAPVQTGVVKLHLYLGANGRVEEIDIFESRPAGVFESAAAQAFAAVRFTPGMRRGKAVPAVLTLELQFGTPLEVDPRVARSAEGERARPQNPNAVDAPDRAAVRKRAARAPRGG